MIQSNLMQAPSCRQNYSLSNHYNYPKEIEEGLLQIIPNQIKYKCSIRKILRSIITVLKINLFQSALLGWLLKDTPFDLHALQIHIDANQMDQLDAKVQQFILFRAYQVKQELYPLTDPQEEFSHYFQPFITSYQDWKPDKSLKNLTLNQINKIFEDWTSKSTNQTQVDYNKLVTKILDLSKSYNVTDKTEQEKQIKKKRKINPTRQKTKSISNKSIKYSKIYSTPNKRETIKNSFQQQQFDFAEHEQSNNLKWDPIRSHSRNYLPRTFTMKSDKSSLLGSKNSFDLFGNQSFLAYPGMNLRSSTIEHLNKIDSKDPK